MSVKEIKVKNIKAFRDGFNVGYEMAIKKQKLTKVSPPFFEAALSLTYSSSFIQGVKQGWGYGLELQTEKIRQQTREEHREKEDTERSKTVQTQKKPQMSELEKKIWAFQKQDIERLRRAEERTKRMMQLREVQNRDRNAPDRER